MTTLTLRSFALPALALLVLGGTATAQTPSSALLTTLEVQQLVKRAEPADNARLAAHFTALANQYAADAKRHMAMAQAFIGTPAKQAAAISASDHCKRLAQLNTEAAQTVRELARYHERLATGAASTPPKDSARYQGGAGASEPSDAQLTALAAKAATPADHRALAEYFVTSAKRYTASATEHAAMAAAYRGTKIAQAAAHCDRLVQVSRDEAKEANALAAEHNQLAGIAR